MNARDRHDGPAADGLHRGSTTAGETAWHRVPVADGQDLTAGLEGELTSLRAGTHADPHAVLGAHPHPSGGTRIVTLRPTAVAVSAWVDGRDHRLHDWGDGLFGAVLPLTDVADYQLDVIYPTGAVRTAEAYTFAPTVSDTDLRLFERGDLPRPWEVLGARRRSLATAAGRVDGTSFAVWAPRAVGVTVLGDFDAWNGRSAPMRRLRGGVWEVFLPGVDVDERYKFRIRQPDGKTCDKADPFATATERPPATASVVHASRHRWHDHAWIARRAERDPRREPMSVFEVHLGSWRRGLSYRELAAELIAYVRDLGFTHVELMPVAEHPYGGSWGYQVSSYYAPTARFGGPDEFREFVDLLHANGIGVLLDWVPAHFPKDDWALGRFDGSALFEHPDPQRGEHPDWGTYIFDFGRPQVRNFLIGAALYWIDQFHIDGMRVDAVASMLYLDYSRAPGQWTPNMHGGNENMDAVHFLRDLNDAVSRQFPGVAMIAEESTTWPGVTAATDDGGLGFTLKWNLGWMHDTLDYLAHDPYFRSHHHGRITESLHHAFDERFLLPLSHDEVVHGKGTLWSRMPGGPDERAAGVRCFLAYTWAHPGKQLLFMGQEYAQRSEWSEHRGLDWADAQLPTHEGIRQVVRDLNRVYRLRPELSRSDHDTRFFSWIVADDAHNNVIAFLRGADEGSATACVFNFSGRDLYGYRLGLPHAGQWAELLNTAAREYGGSGVGNLGRVAAQPVGWHGRAASAELTLPARSAILLGWEPPAGAARRMPGA